MQSDMLHVSILTYNRSVPHHLLRRESQASKRRFSLDSLGIQEACGK